jgi:hypothetical protein
MSLDSSRLVGVNTEDLQTDEGQGRDNSQCNPISQEEACHQSDYNGSRAFTPQAPM